MGVAVVVEVLEELVAGDVAAGFDDAGEAAVGEVDGVLDAGFAFEVEGEAGAVDVDVAAAEGGEAEGVVFAGVGFVADADEGGFEEADDGGENFFAGKAGEGEVLVDALADGGEGGAEVRACARTWIGRGFRASGGDSGIACGRGRRGRWLADGRWRWGRSRRSAQAGGMTRDLMRARVSLSRQGFVVGGAVGEAGAGAVAGDAGAGVVDVAEAGGAGGVDGVGEGGGRAAGLAGRLRGDLAGAGHMERLDAGSRGEGRFRGREFEGMKRGVRGLVLARTTLLVAMNSDGRDACARPCHNWLGKPGRHHPQEINHGIARCFSR